MYLINQIANHLRLALAEFLGSLETQLSRSTGVKEHLQTQVARIDEYMETQRARITPYRSTRRDIDDIVPQLEHSQPNVQFQDAGFEDFSNSLGQEWQIPSELLEGWPWLFDFTQGFVEYPEAVSRE